jgi:hypothetical protein
MVELVFALFVPAPSICPVVAVSEFTVEALFALLVESFAESEEPSGKCHTPL